MTRGSLTTFSIANDLAKYFAVIPALLVPLYPGLEVLNIMHLATPASAMSPCSSSSWVARNSPGAGHGGRTFTSDRNASHSASVEALARPP